MKKITALLWLGLMMASALQAQNIPQTLTLKKGQWEFIGDRAIIEVTEIADSRCPVGAWCFWEGDVWVTLLLETIDTRRVVMLRLHRENSGHQIVEDFDLSLKAVNPYPKPGECVAKEVVLEIADLY